MGLINLISFTLGFFWRACVNNPFWEGEDWRLLWGLGLLFSARFFFGYTWSFCRGRRRHPRWLREEVENFADKESNRWVSHPSVFACLAWTVPSLAWTIFLLPQALIYLFLASKRLWSTQAQLDEWCRLNKGDGKTSMIWNSGGYCVCATA